MPRVLLADDEAPARAKLRRYLAEASDFEVVGEADGGRSALEQVAALKPDVLFLDVQMPDIDGFGVVEALPPDALPRIVFVTAHDAYALRAFEVHAFDYLLKPVSPQRFAELLARLRAGLAPPHAGDAETRLAALLEALPQPKRYAVHLLLEDAGHARFVEVERVDRIEADRNYLVVHAQGRAYRLRGTLERMAARLDPARFLRVNRSTLVRIAAVREVTPWPDGEFRLLLDDGSRVTWTRRYVDAAPPSLLLRP